MLEVTLPIALVAGMTLCATFFHLLVTLRSRAERVDYAFTATSFGVFLYDLCQIGIYVAGSPEAAKPFVELECGVIYVSFGFFVVALERYRRRSVRLWAFPLLGLCALLGVLCIWNPGGIAVTDTPTTLTLTLGGREPIVVHELLPGPLASLVTVLMMIVSALIVQLIRDLMRAGQRVHAYVLMVSGGLFVVAMVNDALVFFRFYEALYLSEYAYSTFACLMVASSAREVVDARHAELRLKASEERFRATLTSIGDAVLAVDRRRIVTDLNPAAESLFGAREVLVGKGIGEVIVISRASAEGQSERGGAEPFASVSSGILRVRGVDDVERIVDCKATPLRDESDEIVGSVLVYRDVTEQRKLEDRLRRAERLELIGRLAGGIAHDLNNMLAPIMGFAQVAQKKLPDGHPVRPLASRIEEASMKAAELTRQLLAMGRRQTLRVRPLRVGEIVAELVPMIRRVLPEDFHLDVHDETPEAWIRGDRNELERVVLNLVLNARDAMHRGGTIELRTSVVTHERASSKMSVSGVYVRMSVRDSGHGMDAETQRHIFEPFFTTKETGRGTGLGLPTVLGVVEQHDGFVEVESTVGQGSIFHVHFPLAPPPREVSCTHLLPSGETPLGPTGSTILLVEDDGLVRKLAHDVLADAGYEVLVAVDGARALEIGADTSTQIDLLLTDVIMPRASGPEIARVLLQARPELRVLYMSGHPANELGARGLVERDVDLLRKPFAIEELLTRIVRALRARPK